MQKRNKQNKQSHCHTDFEPTSSLASTPVSYFSVKTNSNYYQWQTSVVNTHRILTSRFNLDPLFLPWLQADSIPLQWETTPTILFTSSFGVTSKTVQIFWLVYNQFDLSEHNYSQRDKMAAMQKLRTELWKISFNHHNYTPDPNPEPEPKSDFTRFKTVIGFHKTRNTCTGGQGWTDCKMVKVWQEDCRCSTAPDSPTTAGATTNVRHPLNRIH